MGLFDKLFRPPSKDKFAKLVMDGIRRAGESGPVVYDTEKFCLRKENRQVTSLANAYIEYCAASHQDRKNVLKRWVRGWFALDKEDPEEYEDIRPDLLPAVRSRAYFELMSLRAEVEHQIVQHWPYRPIAEHLAAGLIYSTPDAMRYIRQDELEGWGVTFYEAMEAATENLEQLPPRFLSPEDGGRLYLSASGDNHDASRLLLLEMIRGFRVEGEPVALVPTRDMLIVAGSEDMRGLNGMVALAKGEQGEHHRVSTIALRLDGDEWVPWLPEPNHPLHNDIKMMQVQSLDGDYRVQKDFLDKLHGKTGQDVFVATYNGVQNEKTGHVRAYTVWAGGIDSWLPQADIIAFMRDPEDQPRMYDWDRVMEAAGDLLEPLEMYPPRFRVTEFPTEQQFAAMGAPRSL